MFAESVAVSERKRAWAFVIAQFVLLVALVVLPDGDTWTLSESLDTAVLAVRWAAIGVIVAGLVGLGPSLSPFPVPNVGARLQTGGVYGLSRHPVYAGLIVLAVGWAVDSGSPVTALVAVVFVVLMASKARWEEQRLLAQLDGYAAYAARVGRFLPGIGRLG